MGIHGWFGRESKRQIWGQKRSKETSNICIKMYVLTLHMISKGLHALRQALF